VVYGLAFLDLSKEPVVIQVPDFKDRFWVYAMYDARTDEVRAMRKGREGEGRARRYHLPRLFSFNNGRRKR